MSKATREGFADEILALGQENPGIFIIDADLGGSCKTDAFKKALPEQHVNVGIAEQSAGGLAAGLAASGIIPFVVTYAAFGSMRMLEMIRQEVCYTNLNVKLACSHAGFTPDADGASHQCIEDMGIYTTIPNMTVCMPADYHSARKLVRAAAEKYGPVYLRFTRNGMPDIYGPDETFEFGKAKLLRPGKDAAIFAIGDTVHLALEAAAELSNEGIDARVIDMHTIKPLDVACVAAAARDTGKVVTVEDHNIFNGLGTAVGTAMAEVGCGKLRRIGVQDRFGMSAPYERLMAQNDITVENIIAQVKGLQ